MANENWMVVYSYAVERSEHYGINEFLRRPDRSPYELLVDLNTGSFGLAKPRKDRREEPEIVCRAKTVPAIDAWLDERRELVEVTRWVWLGTGMVKISVAYDLVGQCWKMRDGNGWRVISFHKPVYDMTDQRAAELNALYAEYESAARLSDDAWQRFKSEFDKDIPEPDGDE